MSHSTHRIGARRGRKQSSALRPGVPWEVINSLEQGVAVLGSGGRFKQVNAAFTRLAARSRDQLYGMTLFDVIDPGDHESLRQANGRRLAGERFSYGARLLRPDGAIVPLRITELPRLKRGQLAGTYAVTKEVIEQQERQAEPFGSTGSKQIVEDLRLSIQHSPVARAMFDREMRYLAYSPHWLVAHRLQEQELAGRSHYDVIPEIPEPWRQVYERGLAGETILREEDALVRRGGSVQWLRWEVRPWYTSDGAIGGILVFSEDVTEHKRTEEKLVELQEMFVEAESVAGIGSWKWDLDTLKLTWSKEMFNLFGVDPEAFDSDIERVLDERIHPDDRAAVNAANLSVLRLHNPQPLEYRIVLPDGTERIVWAEGRLKRDQSGRPTALVGYVQDITQRKLSENAIRESQAQLQHVVDTVPEGVMLLTSDGLVRLTNPVAERYLEILAPGWDSRPLTQLGNVALNELLTSPPRGLWHEVTQDNSFFEAIARPLEHDEMNTGWVLVLRDVTQEREIRQRVQQQERLAAVGQLAAGIAHDFNNILAVITLYAELLAGTVALPARAQERLRVISQQGMRATALIHQILDFSRQSVMERQALDLVPFTRELVRLLRRTLPEDIQVELSYEPGAYQIHADPARLQQVMMNLVLNARDAMPQGGRLEISLAPVQSGEKSQPLPEMPPGNWIEVKVTDSGVGIPPAVLPRLFEPFFTTKEVGKGTGLGLAQVLGIVQQHGGHIDVGTKMGEGTTFTLYFPALDAGASATATRDSSSLQRGQGERVLLVEDDPVTRQALVDSLQFLNYEVIEAEDGHEALAILTARGDDVDVVLSDVVMPQMGGFALLHAMRRQKIATPMILLTGHPMGKEMEEARALGLSGWLAKPPDLERLSRLLADLPAG